ncbi:MAG: DUF4358 domain-containing protein [Oscillospiraceae bacterium]
MKKRILALLLIAAMSLTLLAACGKNSGDEPSDNPSAPGEQESAFSCDLTAFYDKMMAAAQEAPMMMPMEGEMLDEAYAGLSAIETKQLLVYAPVISAVAMEFAFVEVADAADVETVQNIFQARIDAQVDGGAWYPATIEQWEKNSEIVTIDNYVCLFVCSDKDVLIEAFRSGSDVPAWAIAENAGDGDEDAAVDLPAEITAEPSAEPSEAPSEKPSASPAPTPTPKPSPTPTPKPSPTPTPTPTPEPAGVDLKAFSDTVMSSYEFGFLQLVDPSTEDGAAMLDNYYAGLTDLGLKQTVVYICMMSMNNGEFALVEAKDAAGAASAAAIFQERIDQMANGGAWYPEPTRRWSECSAVVTKGNYVMMIVHDQYSEIVDQFNALF